MNDYYGDKTQYNNILRYLSQPKNFKKGKFIAIDSSMGTGKSFLCNKLINDIQNENIIVLNYDLSRFDKGDYCLLFYSLLFKGLRDALDRIDDSTITFYQKAVNSIFNFGEGIFFKYTGLEKVISKNGINSFFKELALYKTLDDRYTRDTDFNKMQKALEEYRDNVMKILGDSNACIILFLNNGDKCDDKFLQDTLDLIKEFFLPLNIPFAVVTLLDYEVLEETYSKKYDSKEKGIEYLTMYFDKIIVLARPDYKRAIDGFIKKYISNKIIKKILKTDNVHSFLENLVGFYKPKLKLLKRYIENLNDLSINNNVINSKNINMVKFILALTAIKNFDYSAYIKISKKKRTNLDIYAYDSNILMLFENIHKPIIGVFERHFIKYTETGLEREIRVNDLKKSNILGTGRNKVLKIEYTDGSSEEYCINNSCSVDEIVIYDDFEKLDIFLKYSVFDYYEHLCGYI